MSVRKRVLKKNNGSGKNESVKSTIPRKNISKDKSASVRAARALSAKARTTRKVCRLNIGSAAAALRVGSSRRLLLSFLLIRRIFITCNLPC